MVFCQSAGAVSVVSTVIGGGDTRTFTAVIKFHYLIFVNL